MSGRDPDLGRDRTTTALGRRDWGWFAEAGGSTRTEREPGQAPWGTTRHVTGHDRFDRTLGIPDRDISMWPTGSGRLDFDQSPHGGRAEAICDELIAAPRPFWAWPALPECVAVLGEIAPTVFGRDPTTQTALLDRAARRHTLDPRTVRDIAVGVGSLVARTTHRPPPPAPGTASLNLLSGAHIEATTQLFLARERVRLAQHLSDPDLPRLWILANGLAHTVPADVMLRVPARSAGPAARIVPVHDDLVGWGGLGRAVEHLRDVVHAATEGRRWLHAERRDAGSDELALAVGVIGLTRPATAAQLAACGPARLSLDGLRGVAGPAPTGVLDLSDVALKAVCDRNGWLLGGPGERTMRELVERDATTPAGLRGDLAADRFDALTVAAAGGVDDRALDAAAFRKNPAAPDVVAAKRFLDEAGREALRRFAGVEAPCRDSLADAFRHRFPDRLARDALRETDHDRLISLGPPIPTRPACTPQTLDLGL